MKPDMERLYTPGLEVRKLPNRRNTMTIGGYGAVFNSLSDPRLGFREIVTPTFFNKSQGDGWPHVRALYEHQPGIVLGSTRAGTLRLGTDNRGLAYEVDLPKSRVDVYESVERGDVYGSSIGMYVRQDDWKPGEGGFPVRHLISGQLDHVAPTATPAYPDATVALRSLAIQFDAPFEDVERDARAKNLNRYFIRTDQMVSATPSVEPATLETRNSAEPQADPALVAAMAKNRYDEFNMNRKGRLELARLREKNEQRQAAMELDERRQRLIEREFPRAPEQRRIDGRDFYSRRMEIERV